MKLSPLLILVALLLLGSDVFGFWLPTPLAALERRSDYLVVGKVVGLDANAPKQRVTVTLEILETFRGDLTNGSELVFEAPFSLTSDVFTVGLTKPNSFRSNETCAVFLRKKSKDSKQIVMTMDDDGKFHVDLEKRLFRHALTADSWKPLENLKLQNLVSGVVSVGGAVRLPGNYPWKQGMTFSNAIALAGGVTSNKDHTLLRTYLPGEPPGSMFYREALAQNPVLAPGVTIIAELIPETALAGSYRDHTSSIALAILSILLLVLFYRVATRKASGTWATQSSLWLG